MAGVSAWVDPSTDREYVFTFGGKRFFGDEVGSTNIERYHAY